MEVSAITKFSNYNCGNYNIYNFHQKPIKRKFNNIRKTTLSNYNKLYYDDHFPKKKDILLRNNGIHACIDYQEKIGFSARRYRLKIVNNKYENIPGKYMERMNFKELERNKYYGN